MEAIIEDARVQNGIKMAVAGTASFLLSLVLGFSQPGWAVITVMFLLTAQFLGDLVHRCLWRVWATVGGALAGAFLVQLAQPHPYLFLLGYFLLLAVLVHAYYTAPNPLAYLVGAMTVVVICGSALDAPDTLWPVVATRILEITVGVFCALAASAFFWPRRALPEFYQTASAALHRLAERFDQLRSGPGALGGPTLTEYNTRLRELMTGAMRESLTFREQAGRLSNLLSALNHLRETVEALAMAVRDGGPLLEELRPEFNEMARAAAQDCRDLATSLEVAGHPRGKALLPEAFAKAEARLDELVEEGFTRRLSDEDSTRGCGFFSLFEDAAGVMEELERFHDLPPTPRWGISNPQNTDPRDRWWYGLQAGKVALVGALSLLLVQRMVPPGAAIIPLVAFLYALLGNTRKDGAGDMGGYSRFFRYALVGVPAVLAASVAAPLLTSLSPLLLFLIPYLFLTGFFLTKAGGLTPAFFLIMMGLTIFLHLQQVLPGQEFAMWEAYFGVFLSVFLATAISRTFAPRLPQREFCNSIRNFFHGCSELLRLVLKEGHSRAELAPLRARLAITPNQCRALLTTMPKLTAGEKQQLQSLLDQMHQLLLALCILIRERKVLESAPASYRSMQSEFVDALMRALNAFGECFQGGMDPRLARRHLEGLSEKAMQVVHELRSHGFGKNMPVTSRSTLLTAARYQAAARRILLQLEKVLENVHPTRLRTDSVL